MHCGKKCKASNHPFAQLNLDEEELIVMESCHSYIHDMLRYLSWTNQATIFLEVNFENLLFFRHLGPTHATDPILLHEINKFPDEAKVGFFNLSF